MHHQLHYILNAHSNAARQNYRHWNELHSCLMQNPNFSLFYVRQNIFNWIELIEFLLTRPPSPAIINIELQHKIIMNVPIYTLELTKCLWGKLRKVKINWASVEHSRNGSLKFLVSYIRNITPLTCNRQFFVEKSFKSNNNRLMTELFRKYEMSLFQLKRIKLFWHLNKRKFSGWKERKGGWKLISLVCSKKCEARK